MCDGVNFTMDDLQLVSDGGDFMVDLVDGSAISMAENNEFHKVINGDGIIGGAFGGGEG